MPLPRKVLPTGPVRVRVKSGVYVYQLVPYKRGEVLEMDARTAINAMHGTFVERVPDSTPLSRAQGTRKAAREAAAAQRAESAERRRVNEWDDGEEEPTDSADEGEDGSGDGA